MLGNLKEHVKILLKKLPIPLSKNHKYDIQTQKIIKRILKENGNAVDVGCHVGEIMDLMYTASPQGHHFGFEPIPSYASFLKEKYANKNNVHIFHLALSEKEGKTTFNYVKSNPAYSGIKARKFDRASEKVEVIEVDLARLDDILPKNLPINLIKIDVEGAEMLVLRGARKTIDTFHPVVIFEHGLGGADVYGFNPIDVYSFFDGLNMNVSTMSKYLKSRPALTQTEFSDHFYQRKDYYYIAYPR